MDAWIALARGPLFRIALAICLLGLLYRVGASLFVAVTAYRRAGDRRVPFREALGAAAAWLLPFRLLRSRPLYSIASFAFHVGVVLVPLFYVGHVALWQGAVPIAWPSFGGGAGDLLSVLALVGLGAVLVGRLGSKVSRSLTRGSDVWVLVVLLAAVASGLLAAHPTLAPWDPRAWLLAHMLLGNLTLVMLPTTKIVHCVLYPFSRVQFELAWRPPAATGRHVAEALAGKRGAP